MSRKVLIIDDEDYVEKVAGFFKRRDFEVFTASSGEAGRDLFKENLPDCVLIDINLPGIDGIETFYRLKEVKDDVVAYFITGQVGSIALNKALNDGARDYLLKPIDLTRLEEIMEEVMSH